MPKRKTSKLTWTFLLLIVACLLCAAWALLLPHVTEPSGPVSASQAQSFASIPIPPEATNIRIAGFHHWLQSTQYVRFEAPTPICLATAAKILPGSTLTPVDPAELVADSRPIPADTFRDFSWFDLPKAARALSAGGGPSQPRVWVDSDRGVFYYRKTD